MLNLVLDIERSKQDAEFQEQNGRVHYIFDENIFEMFVRPKRMKALTSTFYSPFLLKYSEGDKRTAWKSFAAQSALLTAEYLLSGELPAQFSKMIYMTTWHR